MLDTQWEQIDFFQKDEAWGDAGAMDFSLIKTLDHFRHYCGEPMRVSCGTQGVHAPRSLHYDGRAVDIILVNRKRPLLDIFLDAVKFPFSEIGIYPDWRYRNAKVGGLHLGLAEDFEKTLRKKMWVGLDSPKGRAYLPANLDSFQEAGLLRFHTEEE